MIHLIRYFLLKAGLRRTPIIWSIAGLGYLISWHFTPQNDRLAPQLSAFPVVFMMAMAMCFLLATALWQGDEFDLVLPFKRRTVFAAKSLATLLLLALFAAPLSAAAVAVGSVQGRHLEAMLLCANLFLGWAAILLMTFPLFCLVKRMSSLLAVPAAVVPLGGMSCLLIAALMIGKPGLLPSVLAVAAGAIAWCLGMRQYDRFELAPNSEGGTFRLGGGVPVAGLAGPSSAEAQAFRPMATPRSGLLDTFSPFVRVMGRALWFRWRYPLIVIYMAGFAPLLNELPTFLWLLFYPVLFLPMVFKEASKGLLPFVPRQTILRCVLAPITAATLLVAGVVAIATDSPDRIVAGLTAVLTLVFSGWAVLPSAKEQARAVVLRRDKLVPWLFILCLFLLGVSSVRGGFKRLWAKLASDIAPWLLGNPLLLSCAMVIAIVLFWWRCEQKFRHYEPDTRLSGPVNAD